MATKGTPERVQKNCSRLTAVLASAVLEWCLLFLLLLDALFSCLVTKFARVCELQTPCLLCSRLDRILGSEKLDFYKDLICHSHKLEMSKLVYCYVHEKLSDVDRMCESCISSITTGKKSGNGGHKSSIGKMEPYIEYCVDDDHNIHLKSSAIDGDTDSMQIRSHQDDQLKDPLLNVPILGSSSVGFCSCCSKLLSRTQRLPRTKSIGDRAIELDHPSSGMMVDGYLHDLDVLNKRREKLSRSMVGSHSGNQGFDPLPYIRYTELKITSDSESEVMISDDDDRSSLVRNSDNLKEELMAKRLPAKTGSIDAHIIPKTMCSDVVLEKLIDQPPVPEPSLSFPLEKFNIDELHDSTFLSTSAAIGSNMIEINFNQNYARDNTPTVSKLVSSDELFSSHNVKEALVEITKEKHVIGIGDTICSSHTENTGVPVQGNGSISSNSSVQINHNVNDPGSSMPSCMDLNDGYKLVAGTEDCPPSAAFTELRCGKDSTSIHDDLKLLLSQMAAVRGFELSWSDTSPKSYGHGDDSKMTDTSSVIGLHILPKRLSIEINESGLESLDGGSVFSEIDGESTIDRLKQQIELDRKSMNALYKELEEERSASAIAANQAMAMINRLQEERAAMQMEAFQYQRMMEEQAEYDQEALQKANDLLTDREKEIQDLEEELETYRRSYQNELKMEKILEPMCGSNGREMRTVFHESNTDYEANIMGTQKDSLLDFEVEKHYILKCLKRLENKLRLFNNGVHVNSSELVSNGAGFPDHNCTDMTCHVSGKEQDHLLFANDVAGNGGPSRLELHGRNDVEEVYSTASAESNPIAIWKQIAHLNERLKGLEEDRSFLERAVNTLKNGNEGFNFVQEIASHLRELRRIGTGAREQVAG